MPGIWDIDLPIVNLFSRWDGGCYANLALNGYSTINNPVDGLWCFFPLYPFLMRILSTFFLGIMNDFEAVLFAGFLISNILFFVNLILFHKLSEIILKNSKLALVSTLFFAFWPGSLFYSAIYSESLFMTLFLGAFYFLERGKSTKSTLFAFLAGLTRSNGFLIFIPFLYEGLQKRRKLLIVISIFLTTPYLLFTLFGYFLTGVFPIRETVYNTINVSQKFLFFQLFDMEFGYALLFFIEALLILIPFLCLLFCKRWKIRDFPRLLNSEREDLKYWVYSLVMLIVILFYSVAANLHRYAIPILPLYWVAASIYNTKPKLGSILFIVMVSLLIVGTILFSTWRWYW